jgi:uncharacterized phosphosugar-binding protein
MVIGCTHLAQPLMAPAIALMLVKTYMSPFYCCGMPNNVLGYTTALKELYQKQNSALAFYFRRSNNSHIQILRIEEHIC